MMTIDYKIRDEKLKYNINRKAAKISALSAGRIDKYGEIYYLLVKFKLQCKQSLLSLL